ncbi:ester cyclase [Natronolimnohabitans innermongolicus]|uniref:Ester cyclase n=1 Tax=Natronolimnohabitans innermongolicus JCM 12255 TaxID=1227499 RepID=L9WWL7_9EURY|nr:ester cyclase [Natronolimnohabitans innermongolicus]ELY53817.1 hypothetical protein C493_13578 [Natronolimnohabitans innermongolicus JCM 12255]
MSTLETEKALVEEFVVAAFEKDDRKTVRRMLTSDALVHTPNVPGGELDVDGFETQILDAFHDAFPDLSIAVESLIMEGTTVICRFTMTGTHEDVFRGIEPSGETIAVTGVVELRLTDAGISDLWQTTDSLELLEQITDDAHRVDHGE